MVVPAGVATAQSSGHQADARIERVGDQISLHFELAGQRASATLHRFDNRAPGFRVLVWNDGEVAQRETEASSLFRGQLDGAVTGTVIALSRGSRFEAVILEPERGLTWRIQEYGPGTTSLLVLRERDEQPALFPCGIEHRDGVGFPELGHIPVPRDEHHCDMHLAHVAFDADNAYFRLQGENLDSTVDRIEFLFAQVAEVFARDVQITMEIPTIIVRETPFYAVDGDGGGVLDEFIATWNAEYTDIDRDLAHLMTDRSTPGIAGLAAVGTVCTSDGYAWSKDAAPIIAHEIGHNWGAGHCEDLVVAPFENNILCGGDGMWIDTNTRETIWAHRDSRECLELTDRAHPTPLPPYAAQDTFTLTREDLDSSETLVLDPLANDRDSNCDEFRLGAVSALTARCGEARVLRGEGPDGRDLVEYSPPQSLVGRDVILYELEGAEGAAVPGRATVEVWSPGLALYASLDAAIDGTIELWGDAPGRAPLSEGFDFGEHAEPSVFGQELRFDGENQHVFLDLGNMEPPWTMSAFIERAETDQPASALLDSWVASVRLEQWPNTGRMGITLYGDSDWAFDYTLPIGVRTHVVLVGLDDSTELFAGGISVGSLPVGIPLPLRTLGVDRAETLRGTVDELRVFRGALDADGITALSAGGRARVPHPHDRERSANATTLSWTPAAGATGYAVYLGIDADEVSAALPTSATHLGDFPTNSLDPGPLETDQVYYWRVDTIREPGRISGLVWQFRAEEPVVADLDAYWALDGDAIDRSGELRIGGLRGTPTFGPAVVGDGLTFAGDETHVRLYGADVPPPWTLAMWVRREPTTDSAMTLLESGRASIRLEQWPDTGLLGITEYGVADWTFDYAAPLSRWSHLVFATDGETTELWVDGAWTEEIPHSISLPQGSLGHSSLRGSLDEVAIWRRQLDPEEISEAYERGRTGERLVNLCPDTVGEPIEPEPDSPPDSPPDSTPDWAPDAGPDRAPDHAEDAMGDSDIGAEPDARPPDEAPDTGIEDVPVDSGSPDDVERDDIGADDGGADDDEPDAPVDSETEPDGDATLQFGDSTPSLGGDARPGGCSASGCSATEPRGPGSPSSVLVTGWFLLLISRRRAGAPVAR